MNIKEAEQGGWARHLVREVWGFLKIFILAAIIVIPIRYFIAQPFIVRGASMEPTFLEYNYLIVDEASYYFRSPVRGEVVIFRFPLDPSEYFIKRVVGLPGETVTVEGGKVTISKDGEEPTIVHESYLVEKTETAGAVSQTLGADEYFVMGDNRTFSLDSRKWGALPRGSITGRVIIRAWPLSRAGIIKTPAY